MNPQGNTILVTGGASGIGLALAKRWVQAGSRVIICGRRSEQLDLARRECSELHTLAADISEEAGREKLVKQVMEEFPSLNVLVNNAGIQNRPPPLHQLQDWQMSKTEIATNLEAPIHLSMLFLPKRPANI
jgi:uncharacterized oxidoreductase